MVLRFMGNTHASYLDKLTKLNNKILRILQKKMYTHVGMCESLICLRVSVGVYV